MFNKKNCTDIVLLSTSLLLIFACALPTIASAKTKVAFIADQGVGRDSRDVLSLIANENVDIVLIQGDFGYAQNTAKRWDENLTNILGEDFPVLGVVGNHENYEWPLYQRFLKERINRASGLSCSGNIGVKASCTFKNLQVVQVAQGVHKVPGVKKDDNYDDYIRTSFKNSNTPWKVCAWHKNQRAMQVYSKSDETGWDIYKACLDVGAMIAMGHAHTYSRTYLMKDYENQKVVHRNNEMTLEPGKSFAVVSGLGGRDVKAQRNNGDWFASVYTQSQGATHGALFCTLDRRTADCYFKAINGAIPDLFSMTLGTGSSSPASAKPVSAGVFSRTDKKEFWWISTNASGQASRTWISESCAKSLGDTSYSGGWSELQSVAKQINKAVNPCSKTPETDAASTNVALASGGYIFSRSDKSEFYWIDKNTNGQMGSIWVDGSCAKRLGVKTVRGKWSDLIEIAPAFNTLKTPCSTSPATSNSQTNSGQSNGYVFSRTDKSEYRWIDNKPKGTADNVWISKACAQKMGGATAWGKWSDLIRIAPGFDRAIPPC